MIGLVGSTGSSTACHVHFEVHINGGVVDPWAWLQSNAG
jgi:murein DD-endopeptidase MepM/ murein hydrolase activator NlpD